VRGGVVTNLPSIVANAGQGRNNCTYKFCWHYDHSQQRTVKGINFVTCLYVRTRYPIGLRCSSGTQSRSINWLRKVSYQMGRFDCFKYRTNMIK
jgi:hypothetical protein